jgi:phospholipid/cholesterol/gamma-HCH transport system substrate-binding protein
MNRHVNYTWVGFFVIALTALLAVFAIWMTLTFGGEKYYRYQIYAKADVSGLSESSPVRFSGVKVGTVEDISIDKKDSQAVVITVEIEAGTPITTSTVASVQTEGITGVQYIGLASLKPSAPKLVAKSGQSIPVIAFQPSLFMQLSGTIRKVTEKIEQLSTNVQHIVNEKNWIAISDTLTNVDKFTANLARQTDHIDALMKNTAEASKDFPELISNAKIAMQDLAVAAKEVKQTTKKVTNVLTVTDGVVRSISQQVLPEIQDFTGSLSQISENVTAISGEVRRNPSVVIRGRKPLRPGPGER